MKAKDIYFGTIKFVWLKLALGGAITLVAIVSLALVMGLGAMFGGEGMLLMFFLWIGLTVGIYHFAMHYVGYIIKAGHVAVIAEAVTSGHIPDDQFNWAKEAVQSRFAASNVYFVIDRLVGGAVRQLQNAVGKLGGILDFIPGVGALTNIAQIFIGIALGYVDECCLGYCFLHPQEGAFKASCDGVVVYFQNTKKLLKNAAKTTLIVILTTLIAFIGSVWIFGMLFRALGWSMYAAALLSLLVAAVMRSAFIDSYILADMMTAYMQVAPATEINFDLYQKLGKLSSKFKKLLGMAHDQDGLSGVEATI